VGVAAAVAVTGGCGGIAVLEEFGLGGGGAAEEYGAWRGMCTGSVPGTAAVGGGSRCGRGWRTVVRGGRQGILSAAGGLVHPDH
jgi:hypothetical protein